MPFGSWPAWPASRAPARPDEVAPALHEGAAPKPESLQASSQTAHRTFGQGDCLAFASYEIQKSELSAWRSNFTPYWTGTFAPSTRSSCLIDRYSSFWGELATTEGEPINHTLLKSRTGISPITQKKLLYALEAVFIVRMHPIQSATAKWTYLFEDQAEWRWLAEQRADVDNDLQEVQWAGVIYRNLRLQFEYRFGEQARLFSYMTRSGVHVPLAIQTQQGVLGIVPLLTDEISHRSLMAAQSFLKRYAKSAVLFVSKTANKTRRIGERIGLIPASLALFE